MTKKSIIRLLGLLSVVLAATTAFAGYPDGYYNDLNGKNKAALKNAAGKAVASHKEISYGNSTWAAFAYTDVLVIDGRKYWWDRYSPDLVPAPSSHNGLNIEHSVPKSWWGGTSNSAYKDINHLNPSNQNANSRKGNFPLAPVGKQTWTNGVTIVGKPASGYGGGAATVYEPVDEYKGDFARIYFYMFSMYPTISWKDGTDWMYTVGETYPQFKPWAIDMLLEWNRMDPVDERERARNEAVYTQQKNRNPFIDFPDLAEYIWGNKMNETFQVDGGHNPGVDPEIISPATGQIMDFGTHKTGAVATLTLLVKGANLKGALSITMQGADCFMASVTEVSAEEAKTGKEVTITYRPVTEGSFSAVLTVSGGGVEQSVPVTIIGSARESSSLQPVVALNPDNITTTSYRARWNQAMVSADYYVVTRTYRRNGQMATRQYMTSDTYYDFKDRDFDADETYSVQYSYAGELSEPGNIVTLAAGDLAAETVTMESIGIIIENGGLYFTGDYYGATVTITDIAGRTVAAYDSIAMGTFLSLPRGIYLVRTNAPTRTFKVMIK